MGGPADITAVKLENKKVYMQNSLSTTWVISQAFPRDAVAVFVTDLGGKVEDIAGSMDPGKSEGRRTTEVSSEDYKLISESETEVSLLEGSFGKLIRVRNENIFREPRPGDTVFEEEGFETERTDDEEQFVTGVRRGGQRTSKSVLCRGKGAHDACFPGPGAVGEDAAKKSKRDRMNRGMQGTAGVDEDRDAQNQHADMHIYRTFFFNRKQRAVRNWKLERAVMLAKTKVAGRRLKCIRIRGRLHTEKREDTRVSEMSAAGDSGCTTTTQEHGDTRARDSMLCGEMPAAVCSNDAGEGHKEAALCRESCKRLSKRRHKTMCAENAHSFEEEDSSDSFDGVTIRAPGLFSVFDVLFGRESLSDEL